MAHKPNIASKKQPRQARAVATVAAIVEAATYILSRGGLADFTSNKVAERAGVNVASFYQYFPNKEALLFHIVTKTWAEQFARLEPILTDGGASPAERLRAFVRELILVEAAEVELRRGLRAASVELRETPEFKALLERGTALFHRFLAARCGIASRRRSTSPSRRRPSSSPASPSTLPMNCGPRIASSNRRTS